MGDEAEHQEPLAWLVYTIDGRAARITDNPADIENQERVLPLFTAPMPIESWHSLTGDDVLGLWSASKSGVGLEAFVIIADEINKFLQEKNQ